ncbi:MAG TPA: FHA domain-containing protein [Vicinamibacterales bacterium]|nr:FHA domain-containing protein [Vicinamibacterales bacterium]
MPKLVIFRRQRPHRLIELNDRLLKIGRGRQNDIVLEDPEQMVSRFHAELRPHGGGYVLVDLNSQNGTWVNAERVERIQMRSGVPVEIGPYELVIEETRAS